MKAWCKDSFRISFGIFITIAIFVAVVPNLTAQNDPSTSRLRSLNNQLLTMYGRLLSSPAGDASALRSQAATVIEQRAAILGNMIQTDPAKALGLAFSQDLLANLAGAFPQSASQLESAGTWEGQLNWVVAMKPDLINYRDLRRLTIGSESYEVYFAQREPAGMKCRDILRVRGIRVDTRIAAADANIQSVAAAGGCNTIGDQKTVVLLVTFPGTPAPTIDPASVNNIFFGSAGRSVSEYWREASYGVTSASGGVFGWYTLDAVYTCDQYSAIKTAAIKAADPEVNFTQYSRLAIIFPSSSCSWAGLAEVGCGTISSADGTVTGSTAWMLSNYFTPSSTLSDYGVKLATHELGHNLGLHHSSSRDFGAEALGAPGTAGTLSEYGDVFSTMGSWNLGHYPAPHKKMLNWMTEGGTIRTVTSNGSFSVQPFEMGAGTLQALKIQRGTGGSDWVWLEFRQPVGNYDSTLGSQIFSGATIHYQDSTTGIHTHLLDLTPETSSWTDPDLAATKSWIDNYTNLRIDVTGATPSTLNVDVTYGPIPCLPANPTVTLSPPNPSVYAGSSVNYAVTVTNNDSLGCSPRVFNLSSSQPSTWPSVFSQSLQTISPSSSTSTTLTKSVPTGIAEGMSVVDSSAQSSGNTGTGYANATVVPPVPPLTATLSGPKPTYPTNSTVPITATVLQGSAPASGASVTFTLTRPDASKTTKTVLTGSNGQATWNYKVNPKGQTGPYQVTAQSTYGSQTVTAAAIGFTVQ